MRVMIKEKTFKNKFDIMRDERTIEGFMIVDGEVVREI